MGGFMDLVYEKTGSGKLRGAKPDNESHISIGIMKNVSSLQLTYQIRFLAFRAYNERKILVIKVPEECKLSLSLLNLKERLVADNGQERIKIVRMK